MAVQSGLPDYVLPEGPCPGHLTVRSEPDSNLPSTIFMPRHAVVWPSARQTPARDGGCRSKVSAPGGEGDGGGCAAVTVFVVGSAVTVWGVFQAATVVSWWR